MRLLRLVAVPLVLLSTASSGPASTTAFMPTSRMTQPDAEAMQLEWAFRHLVAATAVVEPLPSEAGDIFLFARRVITPTMAGDLNNEVEPAHGRHLIVTGWIECTEDAHAHIEVTLTQEGTDARGAGKDVTFCSGDSSQGWTVRAATRGPQTFGSGLITVCATATATYRGQGTNTKTWCRDLVFSGTG